jgi:hypothetical protein
MGKRGAQGPPKPPPAADKHAQPRGTEEGQPFPVHEHVGRQLKALFDEVTTQPIPEKLVKLLEELERRQSKPSKPPESG